MTCRAIIVHGWGADSQSNWFPWLKRELANRGWQILSPDFPNAQNPVLEEWLDHLDREILRHWHFLSGIDTILIGHSLGVPLILRFLERFPKAKKVKAAYLVSGFDRSLGIPETDNFVNKPFDWVKIKNSAARFTVVNSDDDPHIPLEIGRALAKNLDTQLIIERGGGHLNAPHGYLTYPRLLSLLSVEN